MFFDATFSGTTINHRISSKATIAGGEAASDGRWQALGFGFGPTERAALAIFLWPLTTRGPAGVKLVMLEPHTALLTAIRSV